MNVNRVINQAYYENSNTGKANNKNTGSGFYESLSENMNGRSSDVQKNIAAPAGIVGTKPYTYRNVPSADEYECGIVNVSSVTGCDVRQLTYRDSDYAKAFTEQGFTLMAKVNADSRSVYIECKREDGSVNGYEVNIDKINAKTDNVFEQTALEAWGKNELEKNVANKDGEDSETELTHEEALLQFYEFIEDRIKNGAPTYAIGNSEFSVDEWEKFLTGIDEQLEDIREEVKERIEQLKEMQEQLERSMENSAVNTQVVYVTKPGETTKDETEDEAGDEAVKGISGNGKGEIAAGSVNKQYITADEIAGLNSEQLKEQALTRGSNGMEGVPYGYMAKDGVINYKGVIFVCDKEHNAIHLGNTSDKNKCIRISLSKGGCLIVNRENLGDLARAIGMFSPEDVNLILRAIAEDAKVQQMRQQIDEDESGIELVEDIENESDEEEQ